MTNGFDPETTLAARARAHMADITMRGRTRAVEAGHLMHGPVYGYRRHPRGRGFVIVAEEAASVRFVFRLGEAGFGPTAIASTMTARGRPSPAAVRAKAAGRPYDGDGRWTAAEVRAILRRPLYLGLNVFGRACVGRSGDGRETWAVSGAAMSRVPQYRIVDPEEAPGLVAAIMRSIGDCVSRIEIVRG